MNTKKVITDFLALDRIRGFLSALYQGSALEQTPKVGSLLVAVSFAVACAPAFVTFLVQRLGHSDLDVTTIARGLASICAILIRMRLKLSIGIGSGFRQALSFTHTGFALGCIPAVIIIILAPEFLTSRQATLTHAVFPTGRPEFTTGLVFLLTIRLALIALWAAVTEELIFRGLLISVLRRWRAISSNQRERDIFAAAVSSIIFGVSHYFTWGPVAAMALAGLGLGFVGAYIANQERLAPLFLYHFIFDVVSLFAGLFLRH